MLHPHDMSLHISSDEFEKLGVFYLGRGYDRGGKGQKQEPARAALDGRDFRLFPAGYHGALELRHVVSRAAVMKMRARLQ